MAISLDRVDKKILNIIQDNSRISNIELAEKVGISPTPCARRIRQLEEAGVISRYVTLLSPEVLGYDLQIYLAVEMDRHTPDRFADFEEEVKKMEEVIECNIVTGQSADYILKVIVKDMRHYERFLLDRLTKMPGVSGLHSSFILRKVIDKVKLSVDSL